MIELKNEIIESKYIEVLHEEDYKTMPCNFVINKRNSKDITPTVAIINFQDGPLDDKELNGIFNEDLIAIIIKRIECLQKTKYRNIENDLALLKLEEALVALKYVSDNIYK